MEKFELEKPVADELRKAVFSDGFMKAVQTVRRNGELFRISLRPVDMKGRRMFQAVSFDEGRTTAKNLDAAAAREGFEEMLAQKGAREMHVMTASGDIHLRVTRKGRAILSRSAPMSREIRAMPHDRVKDVPLNRFDSAAFLKAAGLADGSGAIRASMRGKYDQVNEFLKVVDETLAGFDGDRTAPFRVVDCGCGKAYLTLALHLYLSEHLGFSDLRTTGVDRREDVTGAARAAADALALADRVSFVCSDLAAFDPGPGGADLVVSLHACDTATDEALAKGVEWKAAFILSAPCCQHELQKTLSDPGGAFAGLLRQGILRERFCDILTDCFRAQIMRILGYRTGVAEFVSGEATMRNIMIKCVRGVKSGQPGPVSEYLALRDYWRAKPWLETRLGARLASILERFQ